MNIKSLYFIVGCIGSISGTYFYRNGLSSASKETTTNFTDLRDAVQYGTYQDVEQLLKEGASISYSGGSVLHEAAIKGDVEIVALLLKHGADVNAHCSYDGWTALHEAAYNGHLAIAQLLIKHGAQVNERAQPRSQEVFWNSETPLHLATFVSNLDMIRLLTEHGADVNAQCAGIRISGERDEIAHYLPPYDDTPLHYAVASGNKDIAEYLLAHGASTKNIVVQPLFITACAQRGNLEIFSLLLERGYDVNEQDKDGLTPLMRAVQNEHEEQVKYLLEAHADTNMIDEHGHTALQQAAECNYSSIAQLLLDHHADSDYTHGENRSDLPS